MNNETWEEFIARELAEARISVRNPSIRISLLELSNRAMGCAMGEYSPKEEFQALIEYINELENKLAKYESTTV